MSTTLVLHPVVRPAEAGVPGPAVVTRWLYADPLGTSALALDGAGNDVNARLLDPFRQLVEEKGPEGVRAFFTGKSHDIDVGSLYDFGARWYDPQTARFVQVDPVFPSPADPPATPPPRAAPGGDRSRASPRGVRGPASPSRGPTAVRA